MAQGITGDGLDIVRTHVVTAVQPSYGASAPREGEGREGRAPVPYDRPDYAGSGVVLVVGAS